MERRDIGKIISFLMVFLLPWSLLASLTLHLPQDTKTLLFKDAQFAMEQAKTGQADVFSPEQFENGLKSYKQAEEDFNKDKALDGIREKLKMAEIHFSKAAETAKVFASSFDFCVSARADALSSNAPDYRRENWEKAEEKLKDAAKTLEKGNLNNGRKKAKEAEELYRLVELESIKASLLDETRILLDSEEKEVKKYAPLTLQKARVLIGQAEKQLMENRYDTDEARQLAIEAKYEAEHAVYLSKAITRMREEDTTIETLFLEHEVPLKTIADNLDLNARFQNGMNPPVADILLNFNKMEREIASLKQDLNDQREQASALTTQLTQLQSQLGDLKSKEESLAKIMEQQKISREKFARVESSFSSDEAQVVRNGDKVTIRLYGLTFPVGKSIIEPQYFGLLAKVKAAIDEYPECNMTIEGHTDSWGGDETNQKLSTERSQAVREYFLASAGIDSIRIEAVGHGELKPIASNETKEGRRKNRRIETIINPKK